MKIMRGLVKETSGPGGLVYHEDLLVPEIKDDEVLIKIICTSICGTDIHIMGWDEWSAKRIKPPIILGHETAGVIVDVGKNVMNRKCGDRVAVEPYITCGKCYMCKINKPHLCSNVKLFGVTENGAFAEYAKIRHDCTFLLDDNLSFEEGCMLQPMGTGVHGVEAAEVEGKNVLISGCGPIGLTAVAACKVFGATKVIACDLLNPRLDIAIEMGADYVINSGVSDLVEEVKRLTDGVGVDAVIDITGVEIAINSALKCLRPAGRLVCVGLPTKPVTLHDMTDDLIYREVELTGISGRLIWDTWMNFANVMKSPYYKLEYLLGGSYALKDYEKALDEIRKGTSGKMLLFPNPTDITL